MPKTAKKREMKILDLPGGGWLAVYLDGVAVYQGHAISARQLVELLEEEGFLKGVTINFGAVSELDEGLAEDSGSLPEKLADIQGWD